MTSALECRGLSKSFGKLKAVNNLSFSLEENKIYALLGRNGAGKTTLLRMISSELLRDSGNIEVYGEEVFENTGALEKICFVKEKAYPDGDKKVRDIFKIASVLYKNWDEAFKNQLLDVFEIKLNKPYSSLSRGGQSMVGLIIGLASRAEITIFDEPVLGLDAAVREDFYRILLKDYEDNPRTIIISTHLIEESSTIFEEVVIINDGELMLKNSVEELLRKAYFISGRRDEIEGAIEGLRLIHEEAFGGTTIFGVFGDMTEGQRQYFIERNIDISPMPLQKLFVYITKKA